MCYGPWMTDVASRELRNNTRAVLARVEAGESITITVDGRPVATIEPIIHRPPSISREAFIRDILPFQADAALRDELREMNPDTTDDIRWP